MKYPKKKVIYIPPQMQKRSKANMKYWHIICDNSICCGCHEEWVMVTYNEKEEAMIPGYIYENYNYSDGFAGCENFYNDYEGGEDEFWDVYADDIYENMSWEEISEAEFLRLKEEGLMER